MESNSPASLYDTFLPQALEKDLLEEEGPKVKFIARGSALTGIVALILIVIELVTLPEIAALISWHIIIGIIISVLIVAKLVLALVRFTAYYQEKPEFVKAGPPWPPLRILALPLALSTILLLGSGFELTFAGPSSFSTTFLQPAHTLVALIWFFLLAAHVFAYFRRSARSTTIDLTSIVSKKTRAPVRQGAKLRLTMVVLSIGLGVAVSYSARNSIRSWEHAFATGATATTPVFSPLPSHVLHESKHAIQLAKQRLKTHLHDVKVLNSR